MFLLITCTFVHLVSLIFAYNSETLLVIVCLLVSMCVCVCAYVDRFLCVSSVGTYCVDLSVSALAHKAKQSQLDRLRYVVFA